MNIYLKGVSLMSEKMIVVYYSWSGNTENIAQIIAEKTGSTLFKVEPTDPYSENYSRCLEKARLEIGKNASPEVLDFPDDFEEYDTYFIGTPNWCSTMAPPIHSILSHNDFTNKTIVPFLTHGGGGKGNFVSDMKKLCPDAKFLNELALSGSGGRSADKIVEEWLRSLGILQA